MEVRWAAGTRGIFFPLGLLGGRLKCLGNLELAQEQAVFRSGLCDHVRGGVGMEGRNLWPAPLSVCTPRCRDWRGFDFDLGLEGK